MPSTRLSSPNLTSAMLLAAIAASITFQVYRTSVAANPTVDRFGVEMVIGYAVFVGVALAARSERRLVGYGVAVVLVATLVYAVVGYYPTIHAARPMDVFDWLEGTVYTGLITAALLLTVLRLAGVTLAPSRTPEGTALHTGTSARRTAEHSPGQRLSSAGHGQRAR